MDGIGQDQGWLQPVQDAPDALCRLGDVQHRVKAPGRQRAQHGQRAAYAPVKVERHRAALYPAGRQRGADGLHGCLHLPPGAGSGLVTESRCVRPPFRRRVQQFQQVVQSGSLPAGSAGC